MGEKCSSVASSRSSGELFAYTWIGSQEPRLAHMVGGEVTLLPGSRDGVTSVFRSPGEDAAYAGSVPAAGCHLRWPH